jgi:hypothetical protein
MAELAPVLGIDEHVLQGMSDQPDHLLAAKLEHALAALRTRRGQEHAVHQNLRASSAARQLAETAAWDGNAVNVDPAILLGDLLVDRSRKHIEFCLDGEKDVAVERIHLLATGRAIAHKCDACAVIDGGGVHIRWGGGRGGLNWYRQIVLPADSDAALRVEFARKPVSTASPAMKRPRPRWSLDVLADLVFAP